MHHYFLRNENISSEKFITYDTQSNSKRTENHLCISQEENCKSILCPSLTCPDVYIHNFSTFWQTCTSQVSGSITNTGHSVIFTVENSTRHHINVTGGPLSYKYQFHEIHIHYGLHDQFGSEHSINGYAFPAEVSAYLITNSDVSKVAMTLIELNCDESNQNSLI